MFVWGGEKDVYVIENVYFLSSDASKDKIPHYSCRMYLYYTYREDQ